MTIRFLDRLRCSVATSAVLAGIALLATPAAAQSAPGDEPEGDIVVTGLRAVTATKTDTPITQIPQTIAVVSDQQIIERGAPSLQDALNYTAGITSNGNDMRGDFSYIRGLESVIFLDGLKRNFGFVYLPRSEVYTLERVEALLGPSAVLYGAGSAGGLVNMVSKKPRFEFGGEVTASYGTYNRKQGQVDIYGPLSDTLAVRMVGVVRNADAQVKYMPDDRVVIQPSITWRPSSNTDFTVIGLYQRDYVGTSAYMPIDATQNAPAGRRMDSSTLLGEPDFNRGPKEVYSITATLDHKFTDTLSFHNSTRYYEAETNYGEIYQYALIQNTDPDYVAASAATANCVGRTAECVRRGIFGYRVKYRAFNTDNRIEWAVTTGPLEHKLLAGFDYSAFRQLSTQISDVTTPLNIYTPVYGNYTVPAYGPEQRQMLKQTGFYAQDQIRIFDRASLVVGLRHDHLETQNTGLPDAIDNVMSYRAGLTVDITKTISPYASYSESFQPVSGLNQFGQSFRPLFGSAKEVGVKWQPLRGTLVRANYYWITENNHIVPDPAAPLSSIQGGKQDSEGFEIQADHQGRDFSITASYAHNTGTLVDAAGVVTRPDLLAEDTGSIFATKTFAISDDVNVKIGGGVRHVGKLLAATVATPARTLVDALAELNYKQWTLQVNAINLLDKFYYTYCTQYGACTSGEPRAVTATLRFKF